MTAVSRFQSHTAAKQSWLSRHQAESAILVALVLLLGGIFWHQLQTGPKAADVADALRRYVARLQVSDSVRSGSLATEMQAALFAPRLGDVQITDRRSYPGYWSVEAVMQVEPPMGLAIDVPVRLRLVQNRDGWTLIDARDLSGQKLSYKNNMPQISG
ncbi:hypothetical protein ACFPL7_07940 [Dongia soli]|uniref:Uncharacterized protein n=1 Tax=Dongia soli TaxID=600628 RepID=A0ABU5EAH8_9PROT|nr:hypothetical protein [Dongia soli]MDY0882876.1 hypothetical protein [Dongia soli]